MQIKVILYFLSCFLAFVGGHVINYSAIMYAQEVLHSDLLAGIGFGLCFGPPIILGWFAGAYSDRMPPTRIVIASQLTFVLVGMLFWLLNNHFTEGNFQIIAYLLITSLAGVAWSFIAPSRLAALAQLVSPQKLHGASVIFNLLIMVGFGLAPILIAFIKSSHGWDGVFIAVAGMFVIATLMLARIKTQATSTETGSVITQIKYGFKGISAQPLLWQLLICSVLTFALMGPMQVLLPRFASNVLSLDEIGRGYFLSILAVALISGGIICLIISRWIHLGKAMLTFISLGAVSIFAIALSPLIEDSLFMAQFSLFIAGLSGGIAASLVVAGLQQQAPSNIRGRVMSFYTISSQVVPALFGFSAGALAQYFDSVVALKICAGVILLLTVVATFKLSAVKSYRDAQQVKGGA